MAGLDSLSDPYKDNPFYQRRPRSGMDPQAVAMASLLGGGGGGPRRGGGGGGGSMAAPGQAQGDLEIIYGGNKFNPTSNDATHPSHLHFAAQSGVPLGRLGRKLQRKGFDVGEHPKFGGVAPVHSDNSWHYKGRALDVNYNGGGRWANEGQALSWLEKWLMKRYG